jgi:hypothetical protein
LFGVDEGFRAPERYEAYFGGLRHLECGGVAAKA